MVVNEFSIDTSSERPTPKKDDPGGPAGLFLFVMAVHYPEGLHWHKNSRKDIVLISTNHVTYSGRYLATVNKCSVLLGIRSYLITSLPLQRVLFFSITSCALPQPRSLSHYKFANLSHDSGLRICEGMWPFTLKYIHTGLSSFRNTKFGFAVLPDSEVASKNILVRTLKFKVDV